MNINEDNIEYFEAYFNNTLSDEEKELFVKNLSENNQLKEEFESYKNAVLSIELNGIKNDLQELYNKQSFKKNNPKKWVYLAASFVLFFGGYWFWKSQQNNLYDSYFYKDEGLPITMGNSEKSDFNDAMNLYKNDDFKNASLQFQKLLEQKSGNDTLQYYVAMSSLNSNDFKTSKTELEKVVKNQQSQYYSDANYFLALIYIKENNFEVAKQYLEKSNHQNKDELLRKLN